MTKNEWQPIATAPKDGAYIMLHDKYEEAPIVARWVALKNFTGWVVCTEHVRVVGDAYLDSAYEDHYITHWQPLPEPPQGA